MSDTTIGFEAKIAPELRVFERPIDDFTPYPGNARRHRLDKIAASLQLHQQRSPIVIQRGTNYILKGNGTWQAAKKLGWPSIAAIIIDAADDEAAAYLLDDNLTSDLASNDAKAAAALLEMLGPDSKLSIWSMDEIADVVEQANGLVDITGVTDAAFLGDRPGEEDAEAARQAKTSAVKMKEAPLTFSVVDHQVFMEAVKTLAKAWGQKSTAHVCLEALKRCVAAEAGEAVPAGPPPPPVVPGQVGLEEMLDSSDEMPQAEPKAVASPLRASALVTDPTSKPWVMYDLNGERRGDIYHRLRKEDQRLSICGLSTKDGNWHTDPTYSAELTLCADCAA
jgi:hypothetical protein